MFKGMQTLQPHSVIAKQQQTNHTRVSKYLVRVSDIGRYFSWLLLCDRACPVQQPAFFLSLVLLLGFGKLLSIKKEVPLPLCCDVRGFYHELSKYVTIKVVSARHSAVAFLHAMTHTVALAGTCTSLGFSR